MDVQPGQDARDDAERVGPAAGPRARRRHPAAAFAATLILAVAVGVGLGWERDPAVSSAAANPDPPIVAGAITSMPPSSLAASTSSSTSTSATRASTAPAAPASLAVSPARVDLGAGGTAVAVTLGNDGDKPLPWTADPSAPWLRVSPASGRLDGGERAQLTVTARRGGLPEGDAAGTVELAWGGPTPLGGGRGPGPAPARDRRPLGDPGQIRVSPCTPNTSLAQATVDDESALSTVVLRWRRRQVPMTLRDGAWSARLGPVPVPGPVPWQVVATDVRGNSATASGPAVQVLACRP
jgi:BACON domain-containing protein